MNFCAIRYHFLWVFHVFRSTLPHRSLAKLKFKSILIRRAAKVNIEARFCYIIFCPFPLTFSHQLSVLSLSQFLLCVFSHPFRGAVFILISFFSSSSSLFSFSLSVSFDSCREFCSFAHTDGLTVDRIFSWHQCISVLGIDCESTFSTSWWNWMAIANWK